MADGVTVTAGIAAPMGVETVTVADWVAVKNVLALEESGVYVTVSVSLPAASDPAGMPMVAPPLKSVITAEV